jgi:hypothetical protein
MAKSKRRDNGNPEDETLETLEEGLDEAHRFLKRQWRKHPVAVAAAAVGVGLVLGLMLGGRR